MKGVWKRAQESEESLERVFRMRLAGNEKTWGKKRTNKMRRRKCESMCNV